MTATSPAPLLVSREEAAAILRTTPDRLAALVASGRLRSVQLDPAGPPMYRPADLLDLIAEGGAASATTGSSDRRSPGERFTANLGYQVWAAAHRDGPLRAPQFSVPVASASQLARLLRTRGITGDWRTMETPADDLQVGLRPTSTRVTDVVTTIPLESDRVLWVEESAYTPVAGGRPVGQLLPESGATWTRADLTLIRYGTGLPLPADVLADAGQTSAFIDQRVLDALRFSLERDILTGSGLRDANQEVPLGITATTGVPTQPRGTDVQRVAVSKAIATVQKAETTGPIVVAIHPDAWQVIRDDTGFDIASFPEVAAWIPTPGLAAGTAVVGDFASGGVLYLGEDGLTVVVASEHADMWLKGQVMVRAQAHLEFRVVQKTAFVVVTGL